MDKWQKIVNVGMMKSSMLVMLDWQVIDYIACHSPKLQDLVKSALRKSAAEKNVIERKELMLSQLDCCNLDIAADRPVHGLQEAT